MRRRIAMNLVWIIIWIGVIGLIGSSPVAEGAEAEQVPRFNLKEAIATAEANSTAMVLADLALEESRIAYEEAKADQILRPSVVALQQAENAWQAAQSNRELSRQDLAMEVEKAYYDVLRAAMALDLANRSLAQYRAQLESHRVRREQGMLSDVDLLAGESQVAEAELGLNGAQASLTNARMRFNRLVGRALEAPFEPVDEYAYEQVSIDLEAALANALQTRVELERARQTLALREHELQVNDTQYTPQLTIERSRLALKRARAELAEREIDISLEVRQNYQSVVEAEARIPIQRTNLARAQESLRIAEARYDVGVIAAIDLIDAQRAALQAETQVIQAVFDYNTALAGFYRSAGYSLEARYPVEE